MPQLSRTATDSSRTAHVEFTSSSRHVNEQFANRSRAVHDYCAIVALASVRGYIHGFLDTARHSRDRQRGDMPLQQSRQNGTTCHDKIVAKSRASVSLALATMGRSSVRLSCESVASGKRASKQTISEQNDDPLSKYPFPLDSVKFVALGQCLSEMIDSISELFFFF